jgi:hypothetical protein
MLNLTKLERINLMKMTKTFTQEEIESFHRIYIMDETPTSVPSRTIRFNSNAFSNILEFANTINGDFIMSLSQQTQLNALLDSPIEVVWEGYYQPMKDNKNCLLTKTVDQIHNYLNKLLLDYRLKKRYVKNIAYVYAYLVNNGLENKIENISDIKNKILNIKKKNINKDIGPKKEEKYFEQDTAL